jgi:hypothetical protein
MHEVDAGVRSKDSNRDGSELFPSLLRPPSALPVRCSSTSVGLERGSLTNAANLSLFLASSGT